VLLCGWTAWYSRTACKYRKQICKLCRDLVDDKVSVFCANTVDINVNWYNIGFNGIYSEHISSCQSKYHSIVTIKVSCTNYNINGVKIIMFILVSNSHRATLNNDTLMRQVPHNLDHNHFRFLYIYMCITCTYPVNLVTWWSWCSL
jgi:hypothetical protein